MAMLLKTSSESILPKSRQIIRLVIISAIFNRIRRSLRTISTREMLSKTPPQVLTTLLRKSNNKSNKLKMEAFLVLLLPPKLKAIFHKVTHFKNVKTKTKLACNQMFSSRNRVYWAVIYLMFTKSHRIMF